ncbi:class I mannose-6-phosphate isomerase [Flindersiella endophytica]
MFLLHNTIRPYAWGSQTAIPDLLGVPPTGEPQAELWMGAHPGSPSYADGGSLLDLINDDPETQLGAKVHAEFGVRLPFLLKLLAAEQPLSLQAHPNPEQARAGYGRENAAGIPMGARERSYQDPYAKPELICALTPFEALVGFRPVDDVLAEADKLGVPELQRYLTPIRENPSDEGVRRAFTSLMSAPQRSRTGLIEAVVAAARQSDLPIAGLLVRLGERYPSDAGVVAAFLLNHVFLSPGDAMYLPAGNLHAYVRGFGVEILANSDNVLRGGLTSKHIDLQELVSILDFTPAAPRVLRPETSGVEAVYVTPAKEFRLSRVDVPVGESVPLEVDGPQILVCTSGSVSVVGKQTVSLTPGHSAYAGADEGAVVLSGEGTVYRATANV